MHISDGVLSLESTVVISTLSAYFLYKSIKNIEDDKITLISAMSAMFFISTFIHIPLGITQIHLLLIGIIGVFIAWGSFVAIFVALLLQALLLGYGGLVSIGVNLFIMGMPAILVYYFYKSDFALKLNDKIKFFLVGFLGTFLATLFLTLILYFSKDEYEYAAFTIFSLNFIPMILEGLITMFLFIFIQKTYPKILKV